MKLKTKFQDEDFELGEVTDVDIATMPDGSIKAQTKAKRGGSYTFFYKTKAAFDAEWEDALEEPKKHYEILGIGVVLERNNEDDIFRCARQREIGNYFETEEEAEKALEKLKAFRRLKDKGFKFDGWTIDDGLKISICTNMDSASEDIYEDDKEKLRSDLDTCFGGEE